MLKEFDAKTWGVLTGMLLGDACCEVNKINYSYNLAYTHSYKQEDYFWYKWSILEQLGFKPNKPYYKPYQSKVTQKWYGTVRTRIALHGNGKYIRSSMYPSSSKIITRKWLNKLTPLGLALWYLDDGFFDARHGQRNAELCTDCFTLDEHEIMQQYFDVVWNMRVHIGHRKAMNRIYIPKKEVLTFFDIIREYVPNSMKYKVGITLEDGEPMNEWVMMYSELTGNRKIMQEIA